jgi:hypothetical protein
MQMPKAKPFELDLRDGVGAGGRGHSRQSGSFPRWLRVGLRQSGMAAATAVVAAAASGCATAQQAPFEVALRDGTILAARSVAGDAASGFDVQTAAGERQRVAASAVLAIHGAPVVVPALAAAHLAGGDVVRGTLSGGDASGDRLELLSPVLGPVPLLVDRLSLLAAAGAPPLLTLALPDGVEEALFVRANIGFDVVAGTLHQFGAAGIRFQAESGEPRWFATGDYFALRLAGATAPAEPPTALLLTRTADRLGVRSASATEEAWTLRGDGDHDLRLRVGDLGCLTFVGEGAVFASDLTPSEVRESSVDGDALWSWQRDRSALGGPLQVAGRAHGKGLGVHSRSRLAFRVPDGAARFWTRVGIDDSSSELPLRADVDVAIEIDGKVVFQKRGLHSGEVVDAGMLPVKPGGTLVLEVDFGRGRDLGDRVDWLSPVFLPAPVRRP